MYRPTNPRLYEPTNPEYLLADVMTAEQYEIHSPEIKWWSMIREVDGGAERDELDEVYGEKSSPGKLAYTEPYEVFGFVDINPILQELTKLGQQQINEIEFYTNIADFNLRSDGIMPKRGDIFRISWILTETERNYIWYSVANVTPVNPYNFKYVNWHINAEQTTLHDAPANIKEYILGE